MNIRKNISNIFGWNTKRKLIVFESDDWGSIRTRSKTDYKKMLSLGLNVDASNFTKYDCLESNKDLERLFNLLIKFKDKNGNPPVFTPMCVVANPDFKKIKKHRYENYFYEPFNETCKKYNMHDQVLNLWKKGIDEKIFVPEFHGREHLNPLRLLRGLKNNDKGLKIMFDHQSIGVSKYKGQLINEHLAAFDPQFLTDIDYFKEVVKTGGELFHKLLGYKPRHFVASNKPEPKDLENTFKEIGVQSLVKYKLHKYPIGNERFSYEFNWIGKINKIGQLIITRNCGFEPSDLSLNNWLENCLNEIQNAFFWNKPAVISTHRVNYVGGINVKNADSGLKELEILLNKILLLWPDVEFVTSNELCSIIKNQKN
tara:strand:+ start:1242 stop:2351 length:1110 start_codon:yes stop_codon:yes gene_type:complete